MKRNSPGCTCCGAVIFGSIEMGPITIGGPVGGGGHNAVVFYDMPMWSKRWKENLFGQPIQDLRTGRKYGMVHSGQVGAVAPAWMKYWFFNEQQTRLQTG